ncbi:unnamed protein product [Rangifer tarandus platyrhynchus]|uniref:Uncharacterized protein n=1 Tax=Rangifer tarandus platyrhynchus TaxID=3082113 RepID=A0AC59Z3M6_RANTA
MVRSAGPRDARSCPRKRRGAQVLGLPPPKSQGSCRTDTHPSKPTESLGLAPRGPSLAPRAASAPSPRVVCTGSAAGAGRVPPAVGVGAGAGAGAPDPTRPTVTAAPRAAAGASLTCAPRAPGAPAERHAVFAQVGLGARSSRPPAAPPGGLRPGAPCGCLARPCPPIALRRNSGGTRKAPAPPLVPRFPRRSAASHPRDISNLIGSLINRSVSPKC